MRFFSEGHFVYLEVVLFCLPVPDMTQELLSNFILSWTLNFCEIKLIRTHVFIYITIRLPILLFITWWLMTCLKIIVGEYIKYFTHITELISDNERPLVRLSSHKRHSINCSSSLVSYGVSVVCVLCILMAAISGLQCILAVCVWECIRGVDKWLGGRLAFVVLLSHHP